MSKNFAYVIVALIIVFPTLSFASDFSKRQVEGINEYKALVVESIKSGSLKYDLDLCRSSVESLAHMRMNALLSSVAIANANGEDRVDLQDLQNVIILDMRSCGGKTYVEVKSKELLVMAAKKRQLVRLNDRIFSCDNYNKQMESERADAIATAEILPNEDSSPLEALVFPTCR
jgi:hypothetical protein